MDCRTALEEAAGDLEQAKLFLRQRGVATAAKRADRTAGQGLIESYVHGGRIGALVEVNCETDFVARTDIFKQLVHDIAMQIASMNASVVAPSDLPDDIQGDPNDLALLSQPFIKDNTKTIQDVINDTIASTGEKIEVRRFSRYTLGAD
jgi:elongation factor Ts